MPKERPLLDSEFVVALAETKIWAMRPELVAGLARIERNLTTPHLVGLFDDDDEDEDPPAAAPGVAVVSLRGAISPRSSFLMALFGGGSGSLAQFVTDLSGAAADDEVKSIIIDIDSPGGIVDQVPETAAKMREIREASGKPIVAIANTMACSAAYWLASQADEVVVTPSGELGSIGVYSLHRDVSVAAEQAGIKHTLIHAGKYKVEGNPYEPLSDEALSAEQDVVDDYYGMFISDVATGRGVKAKDVREGYGEGRSLTAERAVKAGLADRVATLPDTVSRLASGRPRLRRAALAAVDQPAAQSYTRDERLRLLDALVASG